LGVGRGARERNGARKTKARERGTERGRQRQEREERSEEDKGPLRREILLRECAALEGSKKRTISVNAVDPPRVTPHTKRRCHVLRHRPQPPPRALGSAISPARRLGATPHSSVGVVEVRGICACCVLIGRVPPHAHRHPPRRSHHLQCVCARARVCMCVCPRTSRV